MSAEPDRVAEQAIAEVLQRSPDRHAICTALIRLAGQTLARLTSHDHAAAVHARLARQHAQRAARCWRP